MQNMRRNINFFKKINIIGGKWRTRKLHVAQYSFLRPTTNIAREMLFNWLSPVLKGANCLDCCAGSGSLGIEALSRYAAQVTLVEKSKVLSLNLIKNAKIFDKNNIKIVNTKIQEWLLTSNDVYDIIFLDPPFHNSLLFEIIWLLEDTHCLANCAWIYTESEVDLLSEFYSSIPSSWILYRRKKIGRVLYQLFLTKKE